MIAALTGKDAREHRSCNIFTTFALLSKNGNAEWHSSSQTTEVDWGSFSHALPLPPSLPPLLSSAHTLNFGQLKRSWFPLSSSAGSPTPSLFEFYFSITITLSLYRCIRKLSSMAPSWLEILTSRVQISLFVRALLFNTQRVSHISSLQISCNILCQKYEMNRLFPSPVRFGATKQNISTFWRSAASFSSLARLHTHRSSCYRAPSASSAYVTGCLKIVSSDHGIVIIEQFYFHTIPQYGE